MAKRNVWFSWQQSWPAGRFRTGVCLHGHTMHSEECLWFLPRYLHRIPGISQMVRKYEKGPAPLVDFSRAYWTPPLTPASALRIERESISGLRLRPLISLTDHDNIEAGIALALTADSDEVPVSVEWTVPYDHSVFHIGVHNLPPDAARSWMSVLSSYTTTPAAELLPGILGELSAIPEVLIVLNHPFWLEEGVEEGTHRRALDRVMRECLPWLHAIELNGTRRWSENAAAMELAAAYALPVISGGDRHACEPAACINLTDAESFSEFVAEIRDGHSSLLFLPHYRTPMPARILEAAWDILRPYPEYAGRERWTDRLFYRGADGLAQPLSALWGEHVPWEVRPVSGLVQFFGAPGMRTALRLLLSHHTEAVQ